MKFGRNSTTEKSEALEFAWELPRFEADEFAAAIVRAWKDEGGGHIRIDGNPKAFEMVHGDTEFVYVIKFDKRKKSRLLRAMTGMITG